MAYGGWTRWAPYVRVADRIQQGAHHAARLKKKGRALKPVVPSARGRALATTFWGRAWCDNLAAYAALANRLDRGRTCRWPRASTRRPGAIARGDCRSA